MSTEAPQTRGRMFRSAAGVAGICVWLAAEGVLFIHYSQLNQLIVLALVHLAVAGLLITVYILRRRHRSWMQARVETIHMPHCETIETISAVATNAEALVQETRDLPAPAFAISPNEEFNGAAANVAPVSEFEKTEDEYDILELPPIETTEEDNAPAHSLDEANRRDCFAAAFIDNPSALQDAVLDFATT